MALYTCNKIETCALDMESEDLAQICILGSFRLIFYMESVNHDVRFHFVHILQNDLKTCLLRNYLYLFNNTDIFQLDSSKF